MSDERLLRQVTPLLLLKHAPENRIHTTTRMQKLVFLTEVEQFSTIDGPTPTFEFEPHNYGPHSETLEKVLSLLVEEGLVDRVETRSGNGQSCYSYTITERVPFDRVTDYPAVQRLSTATEQVFEAYGELPFFELLDYVYTEYDSYTTESVFQ